MCIEGSQSNTVCALTTPGTRPHAHRTPCWCTSPPDPLTVYRSSARLDMIKNLFRDLGTTPHSSGRVSPSYGAVHRECLSAPSCVGEESEQAQDRELLYARINRATDFIHEAIEKGPCVCVRELAEICI